MTSTKGLTVDFEKMSGKQMFRWQLEQEGTLQEFLDQLKYLTDDLKQVKPEDKLMKKWGYKNIPTQRGICEFIFRRVNKEKKLAEEKEKRKSLLEKKAKNSEQEGFELAIKSLGKCSDPMKEFEWVKGHPAMMRKPRGMVDEDGRVLITSKDIKHGSCPSMDAVFLLQNAVNNPEGFYKDIFKLVKAESESPVPERQNRPEDYEISLEEVDRILST